MSLSFRYVARSSMLLGAVFCVAACVTVLPVAPAPPASIEPLSAAAARRLSERVRLYEDTVEEEWRKIYGNYSIIVTAMRLASPRSITNNQVDGVDEGDIVKRLGDFLIVMRRGRLFSFSLGSASDDLRALHYLDVESTPAGDDESEIDAWYNEILVHDDQLIVLGYSYEYEGAVIHRYRLGKDGTFQRLGEILLRSGDYFDTSNYATRIVGNQLVFYLPRPLKESSAGVDVHPIGEGRVLEPTSRFEETVYAPLQRSNDPLRHSVVTCPLDQVPFTCTARSVVGPRARIFYISGDAFYLWLNSADWAYDFLAMGRGEIKRLARRLDEEPLDDDIAVVYRVPLDGSSVEVVQAYGTPINQFSFDETPEGLRVFVQVSNGDDRGGDLRDLYWLDIPKDGFSTALRELAPENRNLLNTAVEGWIRNSRFIGSHLLFSETEFDADGGAASRLWAKNLDQATPPIAIGFASGILERIEPLGNHAVIVVQDGEDLRASTVRLGNYAQIETAIVFPRASQADARSHGFNYRWRETEGGVFAFSVFEPDDDEDPRALNWYDAPVAMKFVAVDANLGTFHSGQLVSDETLLDVDDNCKVSCVDWYGSARPFFIDDRAFALIDYELIEATGAPFSVIEVNRANALTLLEGR